jgi:hypothetical protein
MAFRKKDALTLSENAKAQLADAEKLLGELQARYNTARLADRDDEAAKLDLEIEKHSRVVKGLRDKVVLLAEQVEREENERRVREQQELIERNEADFADRNSIVAELAATIAQAIALSRKVYDKNNKLRAAWPFTTADYGACLLTEPGVIALLQHELFRVGTKPRLLGGMDRPPFYPAFPGAKAPRVELAGTPHLVKPLVDAFKAASVAASQIMRTGKHTSPNDLPPVQIPPAEERPPSTPEQERLSSLLRDANALAADVSPKVKQSITKLWCRFAPPKTLLTLARKELSNERRNPGSSNDP